MTRLRLGIDVGGSSIKAALVDVDTGAIVGQVSRADLPQPSTPAIVIEALLALPATTISSGPIGCAVPCVVRDGVTLTAANVDQSWVGANATQLLVARSGRPCVLLNDADAAGIAEVRFGAARNLGGVMFVLTFGSGIGTALFVDGQLVPNTELGHLVLPGVDATDGEDYASARTRSQLGLDWPQWTARVNRYLGELHRLFWPDAVIIGGAVSEHFEHWERFLDVPVRVLPARFRGHAGIVGAALATAI